MTTRDPDPIREHWERDDLAAAVLAVLARSGKDLDALTIGDLEPLDQFHAGGLGFTRRLARLAGLEPGTHVLDVGGGLGGPARTLAVEFGCRVTVVDLAESYVEAGRMLTALMRLEDRVTLLQGDALDLPFEAEEFDVVWTQNSGMNIADKGRLYDGFRRVIARNGCLAFQEPMAGPNGPPVFPLMWASDASGSHLRPPDEMRALIESAGFRARAWEMVTPDRSDAPAAAPGDTVQGLIMGTERLEAIQRAGRQNELESRIVIVHAVFAAQG